MQVTLKDKYISLLLFNLFGTYFDMRWFLIRMSSVLADGVWYHCQLTEWALHPSVDRVGITSVSWQSRAYTRQLTELALHPSVDRVGITPVSWQSGPYTRQLIE